MTMPQIPDLLWRTLRDPVRFLSSFHGLYLPAIPWLAQVGRNAIKRRNARLAQHWPVADGRVLSVKVATQPAFMGIRKQYSASFTYSYSVREGSETNYYSGDFARPFPDKDSASEWLETLKDKQIRVHVQPDHPEVSAVLVADLDAHFPLPIRMSAGFAIPRSSS